MLRLILCAFWLVPLSSQAAEWPASSADLDEFDNIQHLPAGEGPARLVLGDIDGWIHIYEERDHTYTEVYSDYLEGAGAVAGVFVLDIDDDQLDEIVAYTDLGRVYYFDSENYTRLWSNSPNDYARITSLTIGDIDDDPQPELVFCADGRLIVYDGRDQYEQWRSVPDRLDGPSDPHRRRRWRRRRRDRAQRRLRVRRPLIRLGVEVRPSRLASAWVCSTSTRTLIPEVIGEFQGRYLRIFDIDLRREKSLSR